MAGPDRRQLLGTALLWFGRHFRSGDILPRTAHLPGPKDTTYPTVVHRQSGDLVLDYGLDGETAANGLIRLPQVIAATEPRTVIILEGINDLTHRATPKEVAATFADRSLFNTH